MNPYESTDEIAKNSAALDAWILAIPEDQYAPCPCGCGKKFRFALKDGIEKHEKNFIDNFKKN